MGKVLATTGKETIKLSDDLIIEDQTLAFAYNVGLEFYHFIYLLSFDTYVDYDGIIGLAYPNMK